MSEASVRLAAMTGTLTVDELIQVLRTESDLLAGEAAQSFVTDPVPTCPQWSVRDLVEHTGGVHRWAATVVKGALTQDIPDTEVPVEESSSPTARTIEERNVTR